MPPQQPSAPAPPAGQYDFIMQNAQQPKRNLLPGGKRQIIVMGAVGAAVIVVLAIIGSLAFGGKKSASADIISAITQEQELARLSDQAAVKATDSNTRAMAATVSAVFNSDAVNLKNYLKKNGVKLTAKELLSPARKTNDATLTIASEENHFDSVYLGLVAGRLKPYQSSLSQAYNASSSKGKAPLKTAFTNSQVLSDSKLLTSANQ